MNPDTRQGGPVRRTESRLVTILGLLVASSIAGAMAGCATPYPTDPGGAGGRNTPYRRPMATLGAVTRPIAGNGQAELRALGTSQAELLRKGFILMETRRPDAALHALNRVLYSKPTPRADTKGLTLYLRARAFQYKNDKGRAVEDLRLARNLAQRTDLRSRCDLELRRLAPRPVVAKKTPRKRPGRVSIIPRSQWNAARPLTGRLDPMRGIHRLTIHHSATARKSSKRLVASLIRSFQNTHIRENRWGDIGYHFIIDPAGRVWEGRDLRYQGAHAGGVNNEHNVGICLLGNFVPGRRGQSPTAEQIAAMQDLVEWLGARYSIRRSGVLTHRELKPATTCPGGRLQAIVNRMRRGLALAESPSPRGTPADR